MRVIPLLIVGLLGAQLTACANFTAVREFGQETDKLTSTTAAELAFVARDCGQVAQARRIVEGANVKGANCDKLEGSVGMLARSTNDVVATYGNTLVALADGSKFDYSANLNNAKSALTALKEKSGTSVIDKNIADAATAVADLLLKIATEGERKAAVERMVQEAPHLKVLASHLRSFFASPSPRESPYGLQITEDASGLSDLQYSLKSLARSEPIRAREWQDEIATRQNALAKRASGQVATSTAEAIDAWENSLDVFVRHAFAPDLREWRDQFQSLRAKITTAKDAVDSL